MAYVPVDYTSGNWHVQEPYHFSTTSTFADGIKNVPALNWCWDTDLSYAGEDKRSGGKRFSLTTNDRLGNHAMVTIAINKVSNIYDKACYNDGPFGKVPVMKLSKKDGFQVMLRLDALWHAENSVSAEEGDLCLGGWMCFYVHNHPAVKQEACEAIMRTLIGLNCSKDNATSVVSTIMQALSGDTDPTK